MKEFVLIISISFLSVNLLAQSNIYVQGADFLEDFTINASSRENVRDIKGSPYYNKDFMFGEIDLIDGNKINGLIRYNIYDQELELIVKKDTLYISDPTKIKTILFGRKTFTYSLILIDNKRKDFIAGAYFEVLNQDECKLLIKRDINLKTNKYTAHYGGGGGDGSQRYVPLISYYIRKTDSKPALKIKRNKKFFISLFNDHASEIEKYIKENKIRFGKQDDLLKLVQFYNSLN